MTSWGTIKYRGFLVGGGEGAESGVEARDNRGGSSTESGKEEGRKRKF